MVKFPVARLFEKKARELHEQAKALGDPVYGIRPWYCSASIIEAGAEIAFIGANPGGGPDSEKADRRLGILARLYDDGSSYNAWLDDEHWEKDGPGHQQRAIETFDILFGSAGQKTLRNAACFNVVPLRSGSVSELSKATWASGVAWTIDVLEHVRSSVVVCNGNSEGRSAWSVFKNRRLGIDQFEEVDLYNTFKLKRGYVSRGPMAGTEVVGLPHLSRMRSVLRLREAARRLGVSQD